MSDYPCEACGGCGYISYTRAECCGNFGLSECCGIPIPVEEREPCSLCQDDKTPKGGEQP